jgi:pilus assembly protein CpaF
MLKKRKNSVLQKQTREPCAVLEEEKKNDGGLEISNIETSSMDRRMEDMMNTSQKQSNVREFSTGNQNHTLFFSPETERQDFQTALREVQEYISSHYAALITNQDLEDAKDQMKRYISKFVMDERIAVRGFKEQELIDALYTEMAEYGFLTKYIFGKGIEEIDINSWQDIEVQYSDGRTVKLEEHFESPEHAINVIRRMLHVSGMVLDNASPAVLGHLSKNIRIAVLKTPLVDEDVGIAASIRIVNPQSMKKEDFIQNGTATEQMMDFLSNLIRYGISVCVAGATSSGKTTVLGWLLTTIPNNKRIYTIENGSRELDLTRFVDGKVVNSVIHTITRDSENEKQKVDQIMLLDMALRFNPDIAVVGEMRGEEANAAQEAARTGIAVLTTIHANSCEATYRRMVSLCKRAVDMSDETLKGYVTEAYPVIVFCKQLENKQRRMMEIMECEILPDGTRNYRTLFQYVITENRMDENGKFYIEGYHEQKSNISDSLSKRLLENGMPLEMITRMKRREEPME